MGDKTGIAWTDATWNPVIGCSRVSEGCRNCYAERQAVRIASYRLNGVIKSTPAGPRWTGKIRLSPKAWTAPLHWRTPRRIFVNSMSDLFHEGISDGHLDEIWGLMAKAYWHTFQVLTKRPAQMREYLTRHAGGGRHIWTAAQRVEYPRWAPHLRAGGSEPPGSWPLRNVWLGVSVEDQATADARIPLLLQTPAAVRWVSYEPALGPIDFRCRNYLWCGHKDYYGDIVCPICNDAREQSACLDWLVIGGESGPGARPFDLAAARSAIAQCRAAGVPCFVKQLGTLPVSKVGPHFDDIHELKLCDRKGADPAEWPEDLRMREYPAHESR